MAEHYQQERLQPSLLDRLTDDYPQKKSGTTRVRLKSTSAQAIADAPVAPTTNTDQNVRGTGNLAEETHLPESSKRTGEISDRLVINSRVLRECVKRDLSWLLNSGCLSDVVDLSDYPEVAQSVLNYGVPDLTGATVASMDVPALERQLQRHIMQFEPRILKNSLSVKVIKRNEMSRNALVFEIECDIWGQPAPEHLYLNSELDLETGAVEFVDKRAS